MSTCEKVNIFVEKSQCLAKKKIENFKLVKKQQKTVFDDQQRYRSSYLVQSSFHDRSPTVSQLIISDDYCVLKHTTLCFLQIIGFILFVMVLRRKVHCEEVVKQETAVPLKKRRIVSMGPLTQTNLEFQPDQQTIGFELDVYCWKNYLIN